MSDRDLDHLERDVAAARARLIADLAQLHGPSGHIAQFRDQATSRVTETKDSIVDRAKEGVVDGIRSRVAANPGAALAIGAGLAWRLYRHPPIATALVGAGLLGLMRTDPQHPAAGSEAAARAAHLASNARRRVQDWRSSDGAGQGSAAEGQTNEPGLRDRVGGYAESARDTAAGYAEAARDRLDDWRSGADRAMHRAARAADRWTGSGQRAVGRIRTGQAESSDRVLLGAAAMALAAAVGLAAGRSRGEEETYVPLQVRRPGRTPDRPARIRVRRVDRVPRSPRTAQSPGI